MCFIEWSENPFMANVSKSSNAKKASQAFANLWYQPITQWEPMRANQRAFNHSVPLASYDLVMCFSDREIIFVFLTFFWFFSNVLIGFFLLFRLMKNSSGRFWVWLSPANSKARSWCAEGKRKATRVFSLNQRFLPMWQMKWKLQRKKFSVQSNKLSNLKPSKK